jgi:uncharacterized protein YbaA (DUF1428 family)
MNYVDGFVIAVATVDRDKYQQYAQAASAVFKENGALTVVECWGNDVPDGKLTSFPMAVKCQPDETVVISWVTWPSKTIRDQGIAKAMEDPRFDMAKNPMPFDGKRMIYGGFEMIVDV